MKKLKKAFHKIKKFFRGFTIIEVIVAVSVIGVLASILVVSVSSYINKSKDSKIKAEISEIIGGAGMYYAENFTINGYDIPGSFDLASSGSDYVFSTNGSDAYVVYAKLSTSDNYWCADSTGNSAELESSPDAGVYACISGSGAGGGGELGCAELCTTCATAQDIRVCEIVLEMMDIAAADYLLYGDYDYVYGSMSGQDPAADALIQELFAMSPYVAMYNGVDVYPNSTEYCFSAQLSASPQGLFFCKDSQGTINESAAGCGMVNVSRCDLE